LSEFFAMGGYAVYVWPSYAVAFGVMAALLAWAWWSARQGEAEVERLRAAGVDPRRRAVGEGVAPEDAR
jgi:heme exporter protein D